MRPRIVLTRARAASLLALLVVSIAACAPRTDPTAKRAQPGPAPEDEVAQADRPFYEGTPRQRELVQEQIVRLGSEAAEERLEAARRLGTLGEPAIAALLESLAHHPQARTRSMSAYTLGFLSDPRAADPLARARMDADRDVRLEAAAALLRLQDDRGAAPLIDALEDPDPRVRAHASGILSQATGTRLGFEPDGDPVERQAAVARWRGWLSRRQESAR